MRVGKSIAGGGGLCYSAGHSQVDVETISVVELEDDFLAAAGDVEKDSAEKVGGEVQAQGAEDVGAVQKRFCDPLAEDCGAERVDDSLDFGEFGHATFLLGGRLLVAVYYRVE